MNKAIFLDRDGTINVDVDYLHETNRLVFIEGVPAALSKLKQMGYKLIVISNQSGIGRGYYPPQDVEVLHQYMNIFHLLADEFSRQCLISYLNCRINCVKWCLCLFTSPWSLGESDDSLEESYMVGDKETDVLTAIHAGCKYGLVLSGHAVSDELQEKYQGHIYKDLNDFVQQIM